MRRSDVVIFQDIASELGSSSPGIALEEKVDRLISLRDELSFDDAKWYGEFTQCVATLDSASTFHPSNDEEVEELNAAVNDAMENIRYLIELKIK